MRPRAPYLVAPLLAAALASQAPAQTVVTGSGVLALVEHRVDAGFGLESARGAVFGGGAALALGTHFEIAATATSGTLTAATAGAATQTFAAADLRATLLPESWIALSAGAGVQGFDSPAARQRWTVSRIGAELRLPFTAAGLTALVGAELLPTVSVSGLDRPQSAFGASSALAWARGPLTVSVAYALERYDFPTAGGVQRHEQLSIVTVQVGLRLGARGPAPGE